MGIWDKGFDEPNVQFPDKIVMSYIDLFDKATGGFASLNLEKLSDLKKISSRLESKNFQFKVFLTSDNVRGYSFEILRFGYDVTIYPVFIRFEEGIGGELEICDHDREGWFLNTANEKDFTNIIEAAFKSVKFLEVVGGLIKIAKERVNEWQK